MTPRIQIAETCWYWSKGAHTPLAAMCVGELPDGSVLLSISTPNGGRFVTKGVHYRGQGPDGGWTQIGERRD
jgi:hypothetical protein